MTPRTLRILPILLVAGLLAASAPLSAGNVVIINADGPGEGFNDATPVAPVFGNPGTTLGQQRLNVFQAAARVWSSILKSSVNIDVSSQMNPLTPCSPAGGVLGSAGPTTAHANNAAFPLPNVWYIQALANSLGSIDFAVGTPDISAQFNSDVDPPISCLGAGTGWWYGIGAPPPGPGLINFFPVVLHEIGHGIGFLSLHNPGSGALLAGLPDAYNRLLYDQTTMKQWDVMTNAERLASQVNTGNVVTTGANTTAARGILNAGTNGGFVRIYAPNPYQGGSSISHFDTVLAPNDLMEPALTTALIQVLTNTLLEDISWKPTQGLVADLGAGGLWLNDGATWTQLSRKSPEAVYGWIDQLVADFGLAGLWRNDGGNNWTSISNNNAEGAVEWLGNLVADFGAVGLFLNNGTFWSRLSTNDAENCVAWGSDLAVDFGALGLWLWNGTVWNRISTINPEQIEAVGQRLIADFGAVGIHSWDGTMWSRLAGTDAEQLVATGAGGAILTADLGPVGLYQHNGTAWTRLTGLDAEDIKPYGLGFVADLGPSGVWTNDGGPVGWFRMTGYDVDALEVWGGKVVVDVGVFGIHMNAGLGWSKLNVADPEDLKALPEP